MEPWSGMRDKTLNKPASKEGLSFTQQKHTRDKESLEQGGVIFYSETDYSYVCGQVTSMAPVPYSFVYCTDLGDDSPH